MAFKLIFILLLEITLAPFATGENGLDVKSIQVEKASVKRLCETKNILTVNRQFPGQTIYAHTGQTIVVSVENKGKDTISISWHGGRHLRSDPHERKFKWLIQPGTTVRQNLTLLDKEDGTLWWRAQDLWQSTTVHGALVVYPKPGTPYHFPKPYAEVPIVLGEWWKKDHRKLVMEYIASGGTITRSDALTINGQPGDLYPCSNNETFHIEVETGKTYLLRIVNAAVGKTLSFGIAKHKLTVVGVNGWHTKPLIAEYVQISVDQTLDCILEANQKPDHYYMAAREYSSYINVEYDNTTTTAIVKYKGAYLPTSPPSLPNLPSIYDEPFNNNSKISSTSMYYVAIIFIILGLGISSCFIVWYRNISAAQC